MRARLVTYSVFDDRIYEMIGETCHQDHYPTLFEEWQGVLNVQCHIDRAPHTMAFDNSVVITLRKCPSTARAALRLDPQLLDCKARTIPRGTRGALCSQGVQNRCRTYAIRSK